MIRQRRHHKNNVPKKRRLVEPSSKVDKRKKTFFDERDDLDAEKNYDAPGDGPVQKLSAYDKLLLSFQDDRNVHDDEGQTDSSDDEQIEKVVETDDREEVVTEELPQSDEEIEHDDDDIVENDPFEQHVETVLDSKFVDAETLVETEELRSQNLGNLVMKRRNVSLLPDAAKKSDLKFSKGVDNFHVHKLVKTNFKSVQDNFSGLQSEMYSIMSRYYDFLNCERKSDNADEIRSVCCLHALNHILKTRQRIIKNNAKISKFDATTEYRDQGFTRPKVLFLLPFRHSAYLVVNQLLNLMFGKKDKVNVLNLKRFQEEFKPEAMELVQAKKPDDYLQTFTGNIDDSFNLGIAVTKKSLRLYSDFYTSDIIVSSPLGLRMIVGAEGDKERDYDFLSSLEIVVLDQADMFLMQNWEHVLHIFKHTNIQPSESRGVDFSRVQMWLLEGQAKLYRQILVFSSLATNEISAFFAKEAKSYKGRVAVRNAVESNHLKNVVVSCPHVFQRFDCQTIGEMPEARFQYFIKEVLPGIKDTNHVLIYISSYFDYVKLRNYFRKDDMDFTQICEYTKDGKVAQARSFLFHGSRNMMLFTERFHFYNRYKVKGIRHIVFYQPPTFPWFYSELCNLMQTSYQGKKFTGTESEMKSTVLFCKYDAQILANILGHERAGSLIRSARDKKTFTCGK
ncbi:U3 small nucleolar RNA-associated protein 25 [Halotydeus destructor]|nr:U3 small nucleolar RNA-associated protein 25 [Halotydeus destructor]